jgi:hypothetical protein
MPAKKKVEVDNRSALEIELSRVTAEAQQTEAQVKLFTEALNDLAIHTTKMKQLEQDMVPREAEHRTILANFSKLIEAGCSIKTKNPDESNQSMNQSSSRPGSPAGGSVSRPISRKQDDKDPSILSLEQEQKDKELMKNLAHIIKESIQSILLPVFNMPKTQAEIAAEDEREREKQAAALAAQKLGAADQPASPAAARPVSSQPPAKKAAIKGFDPKVDLQLLCPPGIEGTMFEEVLRLRSQRLVSEAKLQALEAQLNTSRQIVAKRREEGASKAALRKVEKKLVQINRQLAELSKRKLEEDAMKAKLAEASGGDKSRKKSTAKP